ncbi:MAG: LLM class flavin-dependent oxidoreductase [Sphaerobacteraceae bacterium]|nr:MAG: LLM class flavin-dependent oxidoreductase [Sphaerobacteraceae bacterium]
MSFALSVLDLSPIPQGSTGPEALQNTLDLARHVDDLGYVRYWLAEHHNLPTIASSAPEVMIAMVASVTKNLRVGAGGIMLPNHAPLKVAETFKVLRALFPDRIDLGIGRAPGTDPTTAAALRRSADAMHAEDFPQQFAELLAFGGRGFDPGHPYANIQAIPVEVDLPPVWLLGSSGYSAQASGEMGFGYSFASHFSPSDPAPPMLAYRENFRPSDDFPVPHAMAAAAVICGEDDEHAEYLAASAKLSWVRLRMGQPTPIPSPEEAIKYQYSPMEERIGEAFLQIQTVGGPDTVRQKLETLAERTRADEIMVTSNIFSHEERKRSFDRIATVFDLTSRKAETSVVS